VRAALEVASIVNSNMELRTQTIAIASPYE